HHGGDRPWLDHRGRRRRIRNRRLGDPRPPPADDQRRRAPLAARRLPVRPEEAPADRDAGPPRTARPRGRIELIDRSAARQGSPVAKTPPVARRKLATTGSNGT